jgi:hypothetical protein
MAEEMEIKFKKRGYLLRKDCKDLSGVLKPQAQPGPPPLPADFFIFKEDWNWW